MEQDQDEAALMADVGYLRALVEHTIPLAAVPDGLTAKRIRRSAGRVQTDRRSSPRMRSKHAPAVRGGTGSA